MILAIESSTTHGSIALVEGVNVSPVFEMEFVSERAHNTVVFDPVTAMLKDYRDQVAGIAVGLGPGSYGGVRVSIAVANGLSMVLGVPLLGVSSLEGWNSVPESYTVLGDARRKTFFRAEVVGRKLCGEPELLSEDQVIDEVTHSLSSGEGPFYTADPRVSESIEGVKLSYPSATRIAARALASPPSEWLSVILEPHYLRAPYITVPRKK